MSQVFSLMFDGVALYARAMTRQEARRIFSRSLNAQRAEDQPIIRVSLDAVKRPPIRYAADLPSPSYDHASRTLRDRVTASRELRAMHAQSYFDWSFNRNQSIEISRRNIFADGFAPSENESDEEEFDISTLADMVKVEEIESEHIELS